MEYRLLTQLVNEYDTVAGYTDFLESVQTKAGQLAGISIFQNDETGYDLKNIEVTAAVYAGLGETAIDYYPQKGLYTAISYAFTDLILLASMLVLALLLVRQERDSGLLSLVRSLPAGRLHTALAKLGSCCLELQPCGDICGIVTSGKDRSWMPPVEQDALIYGPIRVELLTHKVLAQGKFVRLAKMEYRLLCYLILHEGQVLSRQEILTNIWNLPPNVKTRTLDMHIHTLRKKLGLADYLETVLQVGYRLRSIGKKEESPR